MRTDGPALLDSRSPFDSLKDQPADGLLALIAAFRDDQRADKIDLGIGVYKDETGQTPVMQAVKQAEAHLLAHQTSKSYLGAAGDVAYAEALIPVVFGAELSGKGQIRGLQTPGGTAALRMAAELIRLAAPKAKLWVGTPTWFNHLPIFRAAGLEVVEYSYFDKATQALCFEAMRAALNSATPGDVVMLHAGCHNPTGADLSPAQWAEITQIMLERELIPLIDMAYQGLGHGLEADAKPMRDMLKILPEALIAYSCNKNFGLYRERVGSIFVQSTDAARLERIRSNLLIFSRTNWSMPPDHGAAIVRIILTDPALKALWQDELSGMQTRITGLREQLAAAHPRLASMASQNGLFSLLPLTPEDVRALRLEHGVYMEGSGRINIAGAQSHQIDRLGQALTHYL